MARARLCGAVYLLQGRSSTNIDNVQYERCLSALMREECCISAIAVRSNRVVRSCQARLIAARPIG
jgi:hypothetical protein